MTMKNLSISPTSVKAFGLLAFGILVTVAGITFYNMASIPTDENLFMTTPSRVMAMADVPGRLEGPPRPRGKVMLTPGIGVQGIAAGDLLTAVGEKDTRILNDLTGVIRTLRADSIRVRVFRPRSDVFLSFVVPTNALKTASMHELDPSVLIYAVLPGGASDRAGMRIGDLISRINGAGFTNSAEADAVLRRGKSGSVTLYEGFRDARPSLFLSGWRISGSRSHN